MLISASWTANWENIVPFLALPADLRKIVYTTNTKRKLSTATATQDAARKLLYLTINNAQHNWKCAYNWSAAPAALKIHFGDRLPDAN